MDVAEQAWSLQGQGCEAPRAIGPASTQASASRLPVGSAKRKCFQSQRPVPEGSVRSGEMHVCPRMSSYNIQRPLPEAPTSCSGSRDLVPAALRLSGDASWPLCTTVSYLQLGIVTTLPSAPLLGAGGQSWGHSSGVSGMRLKAFVR